MFLNFVYKAKFLYEIVFHIVYKQACVIFSYIYKSLFIFFICFLKIYKGIFLNFCLASSLITITIKLGNIGAEVNRFI